ncbi:MAG TPA: hypothetical protein VGL81_31425 [Polyangiaceae bacterium]|jgi:hypothetical protein|nr:hypothetical protein [Polyangiaceae bacterium]
MRDALRALRGRHLETFLGGYLLDEGRRWLDRRRYGRVESLRHLLVAVCDHYEPLWGNADERRGAERVRAWREGYPRLAARYRDAEGKPPQHSFFFPGEEYRPQFLEPLAELTRAGLGEVEIHLHHDGDTAETLEAQLRETIANFTRHGHLARDRVGTPRYAFIHGNWALANARADGRWCGVDEELPLLFRTGCYADFTFPAAPDESQPNIVNRIYWPTGELTAKRCYESGTRARVGAVMTDRLLMLQGPLAFARRPGRPMAIRIENSALTANDPASSARARTWVSRDIHVEGRPEWVFVKLHTHGAPDLQAASLLGEGGHELHRVLTTEYNDGQRWKLHYVTAREMFNIAIAAMDGRDGDPSAYRNHVLPPPPAAH